MTRLQPDDKSRLRRDFFNNPTQSLNLVHNLHTSKREQKIAQLCKTVNSRFHFEESAQVKPPEGSRLFYLYLHGGFTLHSARAFEPFPG